MHRKIIAGAMAAIDKDRRDYFQAVIARLEQDKRFERQGNIVFSILKNVIADVPVYLEPDEFAELLFDFIRYNNPAIRKLMYSRRYVHDPKAMRAITGNFITQVIARSFDKEEKGEIETGDPSVHKLTWPYRDTDVLDPEDDPDEWQKAVDRSQEWARRQKTDRRKSGLSRIDDKAMELFKKNNKNAES